MLAHRYRPEPAVMLGRCHAEDTRDKEWVTPWNSCPASPDPGSAGHRPSPQPQPELLPSRPGLPAAHPGHRQLPLRPLLTLQARSRWKSRARRNRTRKASESGCGQRCPGSASARRRSSDTAPRTRGEWSGSSLSSACDIPEHGRAQPRRPPVPIESRGTAGPGRAAPAPGALNP